MPQTRLSPSSARRRRARADVRTGKPYVVTRFESPVAVEVRRVIRRTPVYEIREEVWKHEDVEGVGPIRVIVARNMNGDYIGDKRDARFLCEKLGISPERNSMTHSVCSIGRSSKDGKWYGWSHRAIHGFKVGDQISKRSVVSKETVGREGEGFEPGHVIASEAQAEAAARLFAREVS